MTHPTTPPEGGKSEERLVEIEQRCAAATPGPWEAGARHDYEDQDEVSGCGWDVDGPPEPSLRGMFSNRADAKFIAHARTDIPALLSALRAVTAERDALKLDLRRQHLRRLAEGNLFVGVATNLMTSLGMKREGEVAQLCNVGGDWEETKERWRNASVKAHGLLDSARREAAGVREALRKVEWEGTATVDGFEIACCPECGGIPRPLGPHVPIRSRKLHVGHAEECAVAAALSAPAPSDAAASGADGSGGAGEGGTKP
jgi:hypothetical protein